MALMIFAFMQMTFSQIVNIQLAYHHYLNQQIDDDWAIFSMKLDRISQSSTIQLVKPQSLVMINAIGEYITYEFYANSTSRMIRRLKNGTGHQPELMAVQTYQVTRLSSNTVLLQVEMVTGEFFEQILTFSQEEVAAVGN